MTLSVLKDRVVQIVGRKGTIQFDSPRELASGATSKDFIDGKAALEDGDDLALVCTAFIELLEARDIDYEAVGGLTMGAEAFAHVMSYLAHKKWFSVRKQEKRRGTNKLIEGAKVVGAGWS